MTNVLSVIGDDVQSDVGHHVPCIHEGQSNLLSIRMFATLFFLNTFVDTFVVHPGEFLNKGCCQNELHPNHLHNCNSGRGMIYVKIVCNTN